MKRWHLGSLLLSMLLMAACAGSGAQSRRSLAASTPKAQATAQIGKSVAVSGGGYINVTPLELKTMLDKKDFAFVNVHIPYEGNIAKTDAAIPYDKIDQHLSQLPADKRSKIVLYCRSGRMSAIAAETLVKLGYRNVWNLEGGMLAWEQASLPLEGK